MPDAKTFQNVGITARFHSSLPLLIVESLPLLIAAERHASWRYSIRVLDLPSKLEPLTEFGFGEDASTWPVQDAVSTSLHEFELEHVLYHRGFRGKSREQPIFDIVSGPKDDVPLGLSHLSISEFDGSPTIRTDPISSEGQSLFDVRTSSGRWVCMGRRRLDEEGTTHAISFLRMPDGTREETSWVNLILPEGLNLRGVRGEVLAFDDIYGTLLLNCGPGTLYVVSY